MSIFRGDSSGSDPVDCNGEKNNGLSASAQISLDKINQGFADVDKAWEIWASNIGHVDIIDLPSGTNENGLNLNQEDYLKAVENGLWDSAEALPSSISNDKDVKAASKQTNLRKATGESDVVANPAQIAFMKAIYKATAGAANPEGVVGEKTLALGVNGAGEVVVNAMAIATGQGGDVRAFINNSNATAIAHLHYAGLETKPGAGDHSVPKFANIPNFTITHKLRKGNWKCCNLYEVGRVNKEYKYRSIKGSSPGNWRDNSDWK